MTKINEDGLTLDDIATTLSVLSHLEGQTKSSGEDNTGQLLNSAQSIVRNYEEQSEWREERPSDRVDLSNNATLDSCMGRSGDD